MKTTPFNLVDGMPNAASRHDAIVHPAETDPVGISIRPATPGKGAIAKKRAFDGLERPSGLPGEPAASGSRRPIANKTLRTLTRFAAVALPTKNAFSMANPQAAYSQRANPPTLDTLQQCDSQQLEQLKTFLIGQNAYTPDTAMLCVEEHVHLHYHILACSEAQTNCYGDAIGIAGRLNPGGVFSGDVHHCDALIDGALKDGAVRATNDACPDFTRQMQFFISEDRRDYHVVSRGPSDATWMNKFTGTPRFPVALSDSVAPRLSDGGLTWIIKTPQGEVKRIHTQRPQNYAIHCPEVLCSLPEKKTSAKSDL